MLLLDKPGGMSSNQALQKARALLDAQKAGHTGSLDPIATGLLPLCFGQATKISGMFLNSSKGYQVTIRLGVSTDSGDREGTVVSRSDISFTDDQLQHALTGLTGTYDQVPPMYSAIKHQGQPLYKLARKGIEIDRAPRTVTVHELRLLRREGDTIDLELTCSKGFYVRSLAIDLGRRLDCGAHVTELRRTAVGSFCLENSITLEQLGALETVQDRRNLLVPADRALSHLPKVDLPERSAYYFCQGQPVRALKLPKKGLARLYTAKNRFLGLGEVTEEGKIAPKRLFV